MARIAFLVENLPLPFARRQWQEALALTDAGHSVHVVCPQGRSRDSALEDQIDGVHLHRYPLPHTGKSGIRGYWREYSTALRSTRRILRQLDADRPFDVIHVCNPPDLLYLCARRYTRRGARLVFDHLDLVPELFETKFCRRGPLYRLCVGLERYTLRNADWVMSANDSYRRIAIARSGVDANRVTVVRTAPDVDRFTPVPKNPSLRQGKRFLLCYVGIMSQTDGLDYAVRALAELRHGLGREDFRAVLLGDGDARRASRELAEELEVADVVDFPGMVTNSAELASYLCTADVCLEPNPSGPLNDVSTSNKVLEYMAMGRPVAAFDLPETRVSGGDAVAYAIPNDPRDMAAVIDALLNDPERRERMGAAGAARIRNELAWGHSKRALLDVYHHVLALPPRQRTSRPRVVTPTLFEGSEESRP